MQRFSNKQLLNLGDEQLVAHALANQANFACLVQIYHPSLLIVARSIVGDLHAEDIVQESWVAIYKYLPQFEFRSALKTWLCTITANTAKKRIQKESKLKFVDTHSFDERFKEDGSWHTPPSQWSEDTPEALLSNQQLKECIQQFIHKLKPGPQAVLHLKEMQNLTYHEICNILSISESNVRVLLHRARVDVFSHIEHYQETGEC